MQTNVKIFILVIILLIAGVFGMVLLNKNIDPNAPSKYDAFAQCLGEKGAKFYGAWWCPHCNNQKKLFGNAKKFLPYEECSTPDGNGRLPICDEKNVQSYPTWDFADGTRLTGEISLEELAGKTLCELPKEE